ncbi:MAG: glycosyltransferase family 4 protein [Advenella sp.]
MKKIIIVSTTPETLLTILRSQPEKLAKHFDVSLISSPGEKLNQVIINESVPGYGIPMERGISLIKDIKSLWLMFKLIQRLKPDLIHSYTPKAGLITMLASWLCRTPVRIHTFTGLIFPTATGVKKRLLICIDRLICFCATDIIPEGKGVKRDLLDYKITSKPLNIIGNGNIAGVDTSLLSTKAIGIEQNAINLSIKLSLPPNSFIFCYIGRLNKDKGIKELINAFLTLPDSAYLLIAGELDSTAPISFSLQETIRTHPRIKLLGFMSDVRPVMKLADILVLPSYREGFPNVILEAGAMELPVITTNINGCNEIIESNINGWLVPVRDTIALAETMGKAKNIPEIELKKMGITARKLICERFERSEYLLLLINFYKKTLQDF